ncbi:MAG: leucine-rich repeat domain-containing protein [Holosporaceae bacterium]|nr:leucine-rich repeat domain-containing protein [Holosporaceae bacterium]
MRHHKGKKNAYQRSHGGWEARTPATPPPGEPPVRQVPAGSVPPNDTELRHHNEGPEGMEQELEENPIIEDKTGWTLELYTKARRDENNARGEVAPKVVGGTLTTESLLRRSPDKAVVLSALYTDNIKTWTIPDGEIERSRTYWLVVPPETENIADGCFDQARLLGRVLFRQPAQIRWIQSHAFANTELDSIFIPATVEKLGTAAFASCAKLKTFEIAKPSNLLIVEYGVFMDSDLRKFEIPASVETIGECCFMNNIGLKRLTFEKPSKLRKLPENLCAGTGLETLELPLSIECIEHSALGRCRELQLITLEEGSRLTRLDRRPLLGSANEIPLMQQLRAVVAANTGSPVDQ